MVLEDTSVDSIDLESLLAEHDPGMIFVGPLLSSCGNTTERYFQIARAGKKVYQTINLGADANTAQKRRAAIIEKLEGHCTGVLTFGTHEEMAHAVHTRWPNEETAEILALVTLAEPNKAARHDNAIDDDQRASLVPHSDRLPDGLPHKVSAAWVLAQGEPLPALPAPRRRAPLTLAIGALGGAVALITVAVVILAGDEPRPNFTTSSLTPASHDDVPSQDVAAAQRPPPYQHPPPLVSVGPDDGPVTGATRPAIPGQRADQLALPAGQTSVTGPRAATGQNESTAIIGSTSLIDRSIAPRKGGDFGSSPQLQQPAVDTANTVKTERSTGAASHRQIGSNKEAPQSGPAPVSMGPSPASQPSQLASAGPTSADEARSQAARAESPARRLDDEEITRLIKLAKASLKSGDISSARPLLERAAEAGRASAAQLLGATFDPATMQQLGFVGVATDIATARQWYERARALSSKAAARDQNKF